MITEILKRDGEYKKFQSFKIEDAIKKHLKVLILHTILVYFLMYCNYLKQKEL